MKKALSIGVASVFLARSAEACAVCMGSADSDIAPAVIASMMCLLVLIICLACAFIGFSIYLARRDGLPAEAL